MSRLLIASFLLGAVSLSASDAVGEAACPVTRAPDGSEPGRVGTPQLWAFVTTHWKLGFSGRKLPYFSEGFSPYKEGEPPLAVVARRLDSPAPLVWSNRVNSAGPSFLYRDGPPPRKPDDPGFMITSLSIPTSGCWEIAARYARTRDKIETLTYTVWVAP